MCNCSKCAWPEACSQILKLRAVPEGACPVEYVLGYVLGLIRQQQFEDEKGMVRVK